MIVAIITISDRSSTGEQDDLSGALLKEFVENQGWELASMVIVPDELDQIQHQMKDWADSGEIDLILSTGGTGFAPRDITPEATLGILEREVPGIPEVLRREGFRKTPHAMLSRAVAGIRGRCLIINLPGSPGAVKESIPHLIPVLPHAIDLLKDDPDKPSTHQLPPKSPIT